MKEASQGQIVNRTGSKPVRDGCTGRTAGRRPWNGRFGDLPQNWSDRLHNRKTGKS